MRRQLAREYQRKEISVINRKRNGSRQTLDISGSSNALIICDSGNQFPDKIRKSIAGTGRCSRYR
jgi:hypothetical protein